MVVNGQSRVNGALADASSKSGLDGRARLPRFIELEKSMSRSALGTWLPPFFGMLMAAVWFPSSAFCQVHDHQMPKKSVDSTMSSDDQMVGMADHAMGDMAMDSNMSLHMQMSPKRVATHDDSVRALAVVSELRKAIAKYKDISVAERDGYQMFLPNVKNQHVYHFTNRRNGFKEAFRFNPEDPTSLLYKRDPDGQMVLIGAMYTMPKRASLDRLNERVPLGIAQWHKHVNWCLPKRGEASRYAERQNGMPEFGPESPIATKAACDAVGGNFYESLFGWMIHANVFAGDDLASIFADDHGHRGK
jgi:hypothetical protein